MGGSNTASYIGGEGFGQPGIYGTLGTAATGNIPGARFGAASWTDNKGNLWLFGGQGFDGTDFNFGYPTYMREDVLRRYFAAEVPASVLVEDLKGSVSRLDDVVEAVAIEDMQVSSVVSRRHVVMLCDAFLGNAINAESLSTLAFGLIASDHFEWDDDVVSEVLSDWSAPEINFPLNDETITMHRNWLVDPAASAPPRMQISPSSAQGRLVSMKTKVSPPQAG